MSSRYWTCPSCCTQFDWQDGSAGQHSEKLCRQQQKTRAALDRLLRIDRELLAKESWSDCGTPPKQP
jgi:transposase-like protein